jgi:hypothetical protein
MFNDWFTIIRVCSECDECGWMTHAKMIEMHLEEWREGMRNEAKMYWNLSQCAED